MGHTVLPFTQELYREEESWKSFRRALRREDRELFDELFAYATWLYLLSRAQVETGEEGALLSSRILDDPWDADARWPPVTTAFLKVEGKGHPAHGPSRPLLLMAEGSRVPGRERIA